MHHEGWRDLKEILISILTGKSKRTSNLPTTQKEPVMSGMGGESSNLARELCREPRPSNPEEIKAFPSPSLEKELGKPQLLR